MQIVVIGATGGTGKQLLDAGLERGHRMIAVARKPENVPPSPGIKVVPGDVRDQASLSAAVTGADAVVSCLGIGGLLAAKKAGTLLSDGTSALIAAMKGRDVKRLIVVSSVGVVDDPSEGLVYRRILKPFFLQPLYDDMKVMEARVRESGLEWTLLRPPLLINKPASGAVRTEIGANVPGARTLTRADLARYILICAEGPRHVGELVGLSH